MVTVVTSSSKMLTPLFQRPFFQHLDLLTPSVPNPSLQSFPPSILHDSSRCPQRRGSRPCMHMHSHMGTGTIDAIKPDSAISPRDDPASGRERGWVRAACATLHGQHCVDKVTQRLSKDRRRGGWTIGRNEGGRWKRNWRKKEDLVEKGVLEFYAEMEMKDYIVWGPSVHGGFFRDFGALLVGQLHDYSVVISTMHPKCFMKALTLHLNVVI